jgi:hypothetical protein
VIRMDTNTDDWAEQAVIALVFCALMTLRTEWYEIERLIGLRP